jgi:hypothetical protein
MTTRRDTIAGLIGSGLAAGMTGQSASAKTSSSSRGGPVRPARLTRPVMPRNPIPFVPAGEARTLPVDYDYVEEEWFASGTDDLGQPYTTQVIVRRPRDKARFSGVLLVEPLHAARVASMYMYVSRYIMRSGHAWACIASQKMPLDQHLKPSDPAYYASLQIGGNPAPAPANENRFDTLRRVNQASSAILGQVGAALRSGSGPLAGYRLRKMILMGHSQTGMVTTNYIADAHTALRLGSGASIYDGYFPAGAPLRPFGPRDVPLVQTLSQGDIPEGTSTLFHQYGHRDYRRPDSDAPNDRYRLYELAGMPHMGTRNPPNSDPAPWSGRNPGVIKADTVMNSLPHNELFNVTLDHLVRWVNEGVPPPRAARLELAADGTIAKDDNGNAIGGVRCAPMDVPRATSVPNPRNPDGSLLLGTFGFEIPFTDAKMRALYGTPAKYVERFNARLDELIRERWFLGADATGLRDSALEVRF